MGVLLVFNYLSVVKGMTILCNKRTKKQLQQFQFVDLIFDKAVTEARPQHINK